jgi:hypothetical protein
VRTKILTLFPILIDYSLPSLVQPNSQTVSSTNSNTPFSPSHPGDSDGQQPPQGSGTNTSALDARSSDLNKALLDTLATGLTNWSALLQRGADTQPSKYKTINYHQLPPLYMVEAIANNEQKLNSSDIPVLILAFSHERLYIPVSMLTSCALTCICSNDGLKFAKVQGGHGAGKYMLKVSSFLPKDSLTSHDFLQAYQNWLAIIKITSDDMVATVYSCKELCSAGNVCVFR